VSGFNLRVLGAVASVVATVGVAVPVALSQRIAIRMDGSSTVFPISQVAAEGFQKATGNKVRATVGVSGTGGGFQKFCRGEIDIANASRPISTKEIAACKKSGIKYIELPIAFDGITVVVNPQNNWATKLSSAELKKIWEPGAQGKITNWSQVRSGFPNVPLKLFGPGTKSGTFDYFTESINGKARQSRPDYTASEDDNAIVNGIARDKGALGYVGYDYYASNTNKLKSVPVNGVSPSEDTIKSGRYKPLARPLFIYVNAKSAQNGDVKQFVAFYLNNGPNIAKAARSVALPGNTYASVLGRFNAQKTGTVFGGDTKIGVTVNQLLATPRD
jgi:phosphate transport system substrate-binding protein